MLSSGTRLGPYEIVARIDEGGMGQVYLGTTTMNLVIETSGHLVLGGGRC